jgi:hypothetical protein
MEVAAWVFRESVGRNAVLDDSSDQQDDSNSGGNLGALLDSMTPMIWESMQQPVTELRALAVKCLTFLSSAQLHRLKAFLASAPPGETIPALDHSARDLIFQVRSLRVTPTTHTHTHTIQNCMHTCPAGQAT